MKPATAVVKGIIGGNKEDRDRVFHIAKLALRLHFPQLLTADKAVHSRHVDIKGDQVGRLLHPTKRGQGFKAVAEGNHRKTGHFQFFLNNGPHGGAIVHHDHRLLPLHLAVLLFDVYQWFSFHGRGNADHRLVIRPESTPFRLLYRKRTPPQK